MKKFRHIVATMGMLLTLAACNPNEHSDIAGAKIDPILPVVDFDIDSFSLRQLSLSLVPGESVQLEGFSQPVLSFAQTVYYTSSNPSVASVDASGKVTAKDCGFAIITANCLGKTSECYVGVTPANTLDKGRSNIDAIAAQQKKSSFVYPSIVEVVDYGYSTLTQDDVVKVSSTNIESMIVSTEEAYLSMTDIYYAKTKVKGGSPELSLGQWIIYCTDEFETFLFHVEHGAKRYIKIDCSQYIETGDRWKALAAVLDNLFSVGADYFTARLETVGSYKQTESIGKCIAGKYTNVPKWDARGDSNGNTWAEYTIDFGEELVDFKTASSLGLPSGIVAHSTQEEGYYYDGNYCKLSTFVQQSIFDWRDSHYVDRSEIQRTYNINTGSLYYPDIKGEGWSEGEDIFDI